MDFSQAEIEFHNLKNRYIKAEIEASMFEELVNDLFVQDKAGCLWKMGVNTGSWYRLVGRQWVVDLPPLQIQNEWISLPQSVQSHLPMSDLNQDNDNSEYLPGSPEKMSHFPERMVSLQMTKHAALYIPPWLVYCVLIAVMMVLVMLFLQGR